MRICRALPNMFKFKCAVDLIVLANPVCSILLNEFIVNIRTSNAVKKDVRRDYEKYVWW